MTSLKKYNFWLIVGSQDLYGKETLQTVDEHAQAIVDGFNADPAIPCTVVFKPVVRNSDEIFDTIQAANQDRSLRRHHHLDAHLLTVQDVDPRPQSPAEAAPAYQHPVQPRHPVGQHRHGLHEPEPVGPR